MLPLPQSGKGFFFHEAPRCRGCFFVWGFSMMKMRSVTRLLALIVLLTAALGAPVHADDDVSGAACRAVSWLRGQQKSDGGFGVTQESSAAVTADVAYVLALLGEDVDGPRWTAASGKSPLDALQVLSLPTYAASDPGQAGKVTRAVAAAGANPRNFGGVDLVGTIEGFYDPGTGRYHPSWLFRHTVAIEGLLRSGEKVPQAAYDTLIDSQLGDGGWFWSFDGEQSDVDTTGRVLMVMANLAKVQAPDTYARAAAWLRGVQLPDGDWNTGYIAGPANANSTALSIGGLIAAGFDLQPGGSQVEAEAALDTLLSFQEPSGAFVYMKEAGMEESRVVATTEALSALVLVIQEPSPCRLPYLPMILAR